MLLKAEGVVNGDLRPNPNSLFIVEVHIDINLVHRHSTLKQT